MSAGGVKYSVDYAKRASGCKKCKAQMNKGELRLAKIVPNPFSDKADEMKQYYHPKCIFETFLKARSTTKIIESVDDVENWSSLEQHDKNVLLTLIQSIEQKREPATSKSVRQTKIATKSPSKTKIADVASPKKQKKLDSLFTTRPSKQQYASTFKQTELADDKSQAEENDNTEEPNPDDSLDEFNKLCDRLSSVGSYLQKTEHVKKFIAGGSKGYYKGDLYVLLKLLLPGVVRRVYNINSKQLVKLFAQIFQVDGEEMLDHFNSAGDISDTVITYFQTNKRIRPSNKGTLSLQEVDKWLDEMTKYTKEDEQQSHLKKITKRCTARDLKSIIRLLKHDLRINAGAKHVLNALDANAYEAFQSCRDLKHVVQSVIEHRQAAPGSSKGLSVSIRLGVPCHPMLAEVCRSTDYAMKKCPQGMYAEIKYDGERVQIHKNGSSFHFYSRSLKSVQAHKIEHLKKYIPEAFPGGENLILDSEVLLIDTTTGKPLPFGSLGVHKRTMFKNANVCLFVFDCLYYKDESLIEKPLFRRKEILDKNMHEIPNHILLSDLQLIKPGEKHKLKQMLNRVFEESLEGLMIKNINGIYEPGKRHWMKIKKDYLSDGKMADSADLIVLGAYYGTGNKGGLMSVFLMGCYDNDKRKFCTVTKCGNGHDDEAIDRINKELKDKVEKISKDYSKLPRWFHCNRQLVPDFVVTNPKDAPVWEISGAEFTTSEAHTADGISIRFPRVTKIRDDKSWETATSLNELKALYSKSKERVEFNDDDDESESGEESSEKNDVSFEQSTNRKPGRNKRTSKETSCEEESPPKKAKNSSRIFNNFCIYLPDDIEKQHELVRFVNYFGGEVVESEEEATHVVRDSNEGTLTKKVRQKSKLVSSKWLWDCIKQKKLLY